MEGLGLLMKLLNQEINLGLHENIAKILGDCAYNNSCLNELLNMDAIRIMWSLLKEPSPKVQANAAWALVPLVQKSKVKRFFRVFFFFSARIYKLVITVSTIEKDSGEQIRSFVSGLAILRELLNSSNDEVKASACAAVATVATDHWNLLLLTDIGVVKRLCELTDSVSIAAIVG
jgi:hypothetical protein